MASFANKICRLCLNKIGDGNYEVIKDVTKEILNIVLVQLDSSDASSNVICGVCYKKLLAAFQFKSKCLYTEDKIFPYIDCKETSQLDLLEIYEKENGKQRSELNYQKICRLCMMPTELDFQSMLETGFEMVKEFLPEMNIDIIKDPIVCKTCKDTFDIHIDFLKYCSDAQKQINNTYYNHSTELALKSEELDIKFEEIEDTSDKSSVKSFQDGEDIDETFETQQSDSNSDSYQLPEDKSLENNQRSSSTLKKQQLTNENPCEQQMYRCYLCSYQSDAKKKLKNHILRHRDPSQCKMYKCSHCGYETKYKHGLKKHEMQHKDPSELQLYKCDHCEYTSKRKDTLKKHRLQHLDRSEVKMHKCDKCSFESKYRTVLTTHQIKHDDSKLNAYKCDKCSFTAKLKKVIAKHQIAHSDVREHECDKCEYISKTKYGLKAHKMVHDVAQTYKCDRCDFRTHVKRNLEAHKLRHEKPLKVKKYKCDKCPFTTEHKNSLKGHLFRHVQLPKYNKSDTSGSFKTEFMEGVERYRLVNKSSPQVYKCHSCDYATIQRSNMQRHQESKHQKPSTA